MTAPSRSHSAVRTTTKHDPQPSAQSILDAKAALLGATHAFYRNPNKSTTGIHSVGKSGISNARAGNTSSVRAASLAPHARGEHGTISARSPSRPPQVATRGVTAGSRDGQEEAGSGMAEAQSSLRTTNSTPARPPMARTSSQQAALVAASRASPSSSVKAGTIQASPKPPVASKPTQLSIDPRNRSQDDRSTDLSPIAPTNSLVSLFEEKSNPSANDARRRPATILVQPHPELVVQSPKPLRSAEGIKSVFQLHVAEASQEASPGRINTVRQSSAATSARMKDVTSSSKPSTTATDRISATNSRPQSHKRIDSFARRSPSPANPTRSTHAIIRQRSTSPPSLRLLTTSSPIDITPPPRPATSQSQSSAVSNSARSITAQFHQAYPKKSTPLTTGDELANALVASSLASSRLPSPHRTEAPPPVPIHRKKNLHAHHHHHHVLGFSRTPSPHKAAQRTGLLTTLRNTNDEEDSSDEDDRHPYRKHQKKRLVRKHPNKHHEGDRKRWRDAVTEKERKRYEGVWAANRGLFCTPSAKERATGSTKTAVIPSAPSMTSFASAYSTDGARPLPERNSTDISRSTSPFADQVSNLVAKEIWSRSRLPDQVLEEVWDLVDEAGVGRLSKEQFVVGMWLIDQRLKGRKLPVKVTESVWASVRGMIGIKIRRS